MIFNFLRLLLENVHHHQKINIKIEYTVFFVPRRTILCERILEEEGVYGDITLNEIHLDIIPLEDDVLSLELHDSFKELFLVKSRKKSKFNQIFCFQTLCIYFVHFVLICIV